MPLVSVIIPAFNAERHIGETIEHVLRQTLTDIEVIVVDDGSSDKTVDVVSGYPGVRCVRKPNGGVSSARNRGVQEARGEWVSFVDSDDLWHPDMLASMWELMQRYPQAAMGLAGSTVLKDMAELARPIPRLGGELPHALLTDFPAVFRFPYLGMSSVFMRRDRFLAIGGFDESLRRAEDINLFLRLLYRSEGYVRLNFPAVHVRSVDGSLSSDSIAGYRQLLVVYDRFLQAQPEFAREHPDLIRVTYGDLHLRHGRALLREGRNKEALTQALLSLRAHPKVAAAMLVLRCLIPAAWMARVRRVVKAS